MLPAASPGVAGASYTVFTLSVTTGRFLGDALKSCFAVERLALCLMGLMLALFSPVIWLSFIGVGLIAEASDMRIGLAALFLAVLLSLVFSRGLKPQPSDAG